VVKERDGGIVCRVVLLNDAGDEVGLVTRFLSHLSDSGHSPNPRCAYAYDLRHLVSFLDQPGMTWSEFRPSAALEFLAYLRRVPSPDCPDHSAGRGGVLRSFPEPGVGAGAATVAVRR